MGFCMLGIVSPKYFLSLNLGRCLVPAFKLCECNHKSVCDGVTESKCCPYLALSLVPRVLRPKPVPNTSENCCYNEPVYAFSQTRGPT